MDSLQQCGMVCTDRPSVADEKRGYAGRVAGQNRQRTTLNTDAPTYTDEN